MTTEQAVIMTIAWGCSLLLMWLGGFLTGLKVA